MMHDHPVFLTFLRESMMIATVMLMSVFADAI